MELQEHTDADMKTQWHQTYMGCSDSHLCMIMYCTIRMINVANIIKIDITVKSYFH